MKIVKAALLVIFLIVSAARLVSQNNLSMQMNDGSAFRVLLNDKVYNATAQSQVLLTNLKQDTLYLKVEVEGGEKYGITVYLLNKGKKTSGKEFSYVLKKEKQRLRLVFLGMYEVE